MEGIEIRSGRERGTVGHGVWEQIRSGFGFRLGKEGNFGAHFFGGGRSVTGYEGRSFFKNFGGKIWRSFFGGDSKNNY